MVENIFTLLALIDRRTKGRAIDALRDEALVYRTKLGCIFFALISAVVLDTISLNGIKCVIGA